MKNVALRLVPDPFNYQRILCEQDSGEASMLIWTNFDSYVITYLIEIDYFKIFTSQ